MQNAINLGFFAPPYLLSEAQITTKLLNNRKSQ